MSGATGSALRQLAASVGLLRLLLGGLAVLSLPWAFVDAPRVSPWDVVVGQVIPALAVILFWVLPFDVLMARVFMIERDEPTRTRYRTVMRFDGCLLAALLIVWGPYFLVLLT